MDPSRQTSQHPWGVEQGRAPHRETAPRTDSTISFFRRACYPLSGPLHRVCLTSRRQSAPNQAARGGDEEALIFLVPQGIYESSVFPVELAPRLTLV